MAAFNAEEVLDVHHWTDRLFSFTTTRDPGFRFDNGEFTMIGLEIEGKPLLRAYSMASANHEDHLEFFSIKVPDGPLTSRLQHLKVGDTVLVGRQPTGTLIHGNLKPGKRLFLFGTGTGLAPFASIIKDPETYERYETIVLAHGCRQVAELAYGEELVNALREHEFLSEHVQAQLLYYPTVTREPFRNRGRVTTLLETDKLTEDLGQQPLDLAQDRVMICGSEGLNADMKAILEGRGFTEGSGSKPGEYVVEKAFVEK